MSMLGTVEVERLRLRAFHGVGAQERVVGNTFEVTVSLTFPMAAAMADDDLSATINYAEVVEVVKSVMATPSKLLEHVVGRLREELLSRYPHVVSGSIKVSKLSPPIAAELESVSVACRW